MVSYDEFRELMGDGGTGDAAHQEPLAFDRWIGEQDEAVKTMLDGHTSGLKSALESERENRKKLQKELRELAGKAKEGSEAQTQLTAMADRIEAADMKADFYEEAHAAGVSNLKLAFLVAQEEELFDRRGNVNFEQMKKDYPELFGGRPKVTAGNAGDGTGGTQPSGQDMNSFIRAASGR